MNDLRTAAQQALAFTMRDFASLRDFEAAKAVLHDNLRAALAQQDEPVEKPITRLFGTLPVHDTQQALAQDRHGACPTHCCPFHGCKYMHDDCPVVSGAVQPVYPRNNGCESCADDALAQQAEPVQQVKTCAWRDNLDAIYETECGNLHIVNDGTLEENGMKYCCYCGKEIKDESPT